MNPLGDITLNQILIGAGGIIGIYTLYRSILHGVKKILGDLPTMLRDWSGEPGRPGVPERPGVMVRLDNLEKFLKESTTLDTRVTNIEESMKGMQRDISTIMRALLLRQDSVEVTDEEDNEYFSG